jgi:hypothetical protein
MTDAESNTPSKEHDPSIALEPDFDDYGLHEEENATTVIRIDHDGNMFERIGTIEPVSTGIVLKEHTRLTDDVADDITETYTPVQFISTRTDEFEGRVEEAIFDFVYAGTVSKQLAEQLSAELAESISNQYSDFSPNH